MNKYFTGTFVVIVILGLIGLSFFFGIRNRQKSGASVSDRTSPTSSVSQVTPLPLPTTIQEEMVNPSATIWAIGQYIPSKNYVELAAYMDDAVTIGAYASDCCRTKSKAEVIAELSNNMKNVKGPWNFENINTLATKLAEKDPGDLKDRIIGTSEDGRALAFTLNDKFLITRIFMIYDYTILLK